VSRFIARFEHIERELARRGVAHGGATLTEMDALWNEAKEIERSRKTGPDPRLSASSPPLGKDRG